MGGGPEILILHPGSWSSEGDQSKGTGESPGDVYKVGGVNDGEWGWV